MINSHLNATVCQLSVITLFERSWKGWLFIYWSFLVQSNGFNTNQHVWIKALLDECSVTIDLHAIHTGWPNAFNMPNSTMLNSVWMEKFRLVTGEILCLNNCLSPPLHHVLRHLVLYSLRLVSLFTKVMELYNPNNELMWANVFERAIVRLTKLKAYLFF